LKISVLGTEYDFIETTSRDDPRLTAADGCCETYAKRILIEKIIFAHEQGDDIDIQRVERTKYVKRHELVHAFLFESGLEDLALNEQIATWIAKQFPKMLEAFRQVDAL
jgi:hypothetical protein